MRLLAVDSNSVLNRAFYGIKILTTKEGLYTNGVYGFLNILLKMLEEVSPDAVAFAFDLKAPTFRHKQYAGYKAQRKGMPDELAAQLPYLKELLRDLGYRIVECEGYEADDILGTLADACERSGDDCVIATGDRDSLQLVSERVHVRLASTKMGRPQTDLYDLDAIRDKYGVTPAQLIQVKALMGDTSDNIPGVAGIGEKTALALIAKFGTVDKVYENLEDPFIKPGVRAKLAADKENAYLSLELARICREAPVETQLSEYLPQPADVPAARALLTKLEMFKMIERLGLDSPASASGPQPEQPGEPAAAKVPVPVSVLGTEEISKRLAGAKLVDFLCEFEGDTPKTLAFYTQDSPECCLAQDTSEALALLLRAPAGLRTNDSKSIYRFAFRQGLPAGNVVFDASLAGYILNPTQSSYELERLAQEHNVMCKSFAQPEGLPQGIGFLPALFERMQEQITSNEQGHLLEQIEIPLAKVLASMEEIGFRIDTKGLREFGEMLDGEIAQSQESIYTLAGEQFNINSPKQLGEILFVRLGLPARKKTKTGYSTNADVLDSLKDKHPIIPMILEYRKLTKLKSTYVEGLLKVVGPDGRIHTRFNQIETRTGRISSLEPNLQNIPIRTELGSRLRAFFLAKKDWVLVDADYSQIELRVLAHIAQDKNMINAFQNGEDIHTNTASQVFGLPPLYVTPLMRSRAKAVNFGIVYGIGAYSLSQDIGVSVAEADEYIRSYLRTFSGVKRYMDDTVAFAQEHGYVKTLMGRRRYIPEVTASNKVTQAFGKRVAMNTPIQGTAADIIKIAMIRVYRRLEAEGLRAKLILQVHDELIVEAPPQEVQQVKTLLIQEMENAARLSVSLDADVSVGENWLAAKA